LSGDTQSESIDLKNWVHLIDNQNDMPDCKMLTMAAKLSLE